MGIKKFYELFEGEEKKLDDFKGKTIVIDGTALIYSAVGAFNANHLTDADGNVTSHIVVVFNTMLAFIKSSITTIWVFDYYKSKYEEIMPTAKAETIAATAATAKAEEPIDLKREEKDRREEVKTFSVTYTQIDECIQLLILFGCKVTIAPQGIEAECLCAVISNDLGGCVYSPDSDSLLFGAKQLIRRDKQKKTQSYLTYSLNALLTKHEISQEQLIQIGIAMGSDFAEKSPKIGVKTVIPAIKAGKIVFSDRQKQAIALFTAQCDVTNVKFTNNNANYRGLVDFLVTKQFTRQNVLKKLFTNLPPELISKDERKLLSAENKINLLDTAK